jgi:hypothetical protein
MTAHPNDTEIDSGPRGRERERLCVVTRRVRPETDLIRFVIGPDGAAVPDLKRKLPGRGVWVTATREAVGNAIKRKAFSRGFKRDVGLPADLVDRTGLLLEKAALDALAIAGKGGLVLTGFARVEAALGHENSARERVTALLHAADGSADGVRKLDAALHRSPRADQVLVVRILTSAQLDLALGRPNVIHAALLAGSASDTFLARLRRVERFRNGDLDRETGSTAAN